MWITTPFCGEEQTFVDKIADFFIKNALFLEKIGKISTISKVIHRIFADKSYPQTKMWRVYPQKTAYFVEKTRKTAIFTSRFQCIGKSYPHLYKNASGQPLFIHFFHKSVCIKIPSFFENFRAYSLPVPTLRHCTECRSLLVIRVVSK